MSEAGDIAVETLAPLLGLDRRGRRWSPCPACGAASDGYKRGVVVAHGPRWFCSRCGEKGDSVTLISFVLAGHRRAYREAFAWLADRQAIAPITPAPEAPRFPRAPVAVLLRACAPAATSKHPGYLAHCERRGLDPSSVRAGILPDADHPAYKALAREHAALIDRAKLPAKAKLCWHTDWSALWPIVLPMFDSLGRLAGMHARATDPATTPKTRWPANSGCQGLFFADAIGRRALRGEEGAAELLIVEGFSDFLFVTAREPDPRVAVIGLESGSADHLAMTRFPASISAAFVASHADKAGDRYAERAVAAIGIRFPAYRIELTRA